MSVVTSCRWMLTSDQICGQPGYARVDWYGGDLCRKHHKLALSEPMAAGVRKDAAARFDSIVMAEVCVCGHTKASHFNHTGDCVPLVIDGGGPGVRCRCKHFSFIGHVQTAFAVKDSGNREDFATGSRRDTEEGKVDWSFVMRFNYALARLALHLMKGAKKYGRHNWFKGQPMSRTERSLLRHVVAYFNGESDEDHLAAVMFNAGMLLDHEERIALGQLPAELDDRDIPAAQRLPVRESPSGYPTKEYERKPW